MRALNQFAIKVSVASERQDILESADIDTAFLSNLKLDVTTAVCAVIGGAILADEPLLLCLLLVRVGVYHSW